MSSRRGYITSKEELEELADITVTDENEMWDQVNTAEDFIDQYVGVQKKHVHGQFNGELTALSADKKTIYDTDSGSTLGVTDGYFIGCMLEIVGGAGAGQSARIVASDESSKSVTIVEAFSVDPDTTSVFRIYQLAKFPRQKDVVTNRAGTAYYKTIPDAVKRATAAQVAFMIEMGDSYFVGNESDMGSESIGNYSYSNGGGNGGSQSSSVKMVAPKARTLLRGIMNRTGKLEA